MVDAAAAAGQFASMTKQDIDMGGFHDLLGLEISEWRDGFAKVSAVITPALLNRAGILHGGVLLTMLDEVGALSGLWCSVEGHSRSSVTVDLSGHFTGKSRRGRVFATGELVSRGRALYFTRSEVRGEDGELLAYGSSTHKWRTGSETLEGSPY